MSSTSSQLAVASASTPSTSTDPKENDAKAIKGPPLASRSHTLQILIMLSLNSFLLLMCLYILPAHLLWRRASKQHLIITRSDNDEEVQEQLSILSKVAFDAVASAQAGSNSTGRNIISAFKLLFSLSMKDTTAVGWIKRCFRSTLPAVVLSQAWYVARFKGWWDEAEAMERGDRDEVLKRRRVGIYKQMEVSKR
jgi:hypothetical protein